MPRSISDRGLVVRKMRFSETGVILWWLTSRHGIVHALARHRRAPGSALPDLFYQAEFRWTAGRGAGLAHLCEFQVIHTYPGIRLSLARLAAASYFAEAITRAVDHASPDPQLYDLLAKALDFLDQRDPTWPLVERFERRLFGQLGLDDGTRPLGQLRSVAFDPMPTAFHSLQRVLNAA